MLVDEIFDSIATSGKFAGFPVIFIKLANDKKQANVGKMLVYDIVNTVEGYSPNHVVIYGSDPLAQSNICELVNDLLELDYYVNVVVKGRNEPLPQMFNEYAERYDRLSFTFQLRASKKLYNKLPNGLCALFKDIACDDVVELIITMDEIDKNVSIFSCFNTIKKQIGVDVEYQLSLAWRGEREYRLQYYDFLAGELISYDALHDVKLNMPVMQHRDFL